MTMRKKDYEAIAEAIQTAQAYGRAPRADEVSTRAITLELCEAFERSNPEFKRDRFLADCGVQS